jgi:hypothetical protein
MKLLYGKEGQGYLERLAGKDLVEEPAQDVSFE